MVDPRCERCGGSLPVLARKDARFCSTRCRVAAHRAKPRIPAELRERDRWVRRSSAKVPLTADGHAASSTDPGTWCDYETAKRSAAGAGLGFVLAAKDGIVCIDLDHCISGGRVADWAQAIVDACPPTYVEVSPSGTGLHIFGRGSLPRGRRIRRPGGIHIEAYSSGRYIAMGRRHGAAPPVLADLSAVLAEFV
jgi:primase-polymerase (primpol)-like protein